ncbi:MAG TPA: hypothetical protein VGS41_03785, partial [Chthonomonadales bacterium]|nr:hypothetical protein [Chthonomonadales bacterium]
MATAALSNHSKHVEDGKHAAIVLVRSMQRRLTLQRFARTELKYLFTASILLVLYALTVKAVAMPAAPAALAYPSLGAAVAAGFLASMMRPISLLETARAIDRRCLLEDRLAGALELQTAEQHSRFLTPAL